MEETILHLTNAFIYQRERLILENLTIEIQKGEFIYLIGKTGSGKSSLMKTLYADLPLQEGTGKIVGYNLKALKQKEIPSLRRKIGVVFQDFKLLNDRNVFENLRFVLRATGWIDKAKIKAKINEVLDKVGIITSIDKMPFQLSGGEQQRVAIARALLNDPDLILADEPTGNLDPKTSMEIMDVLHEIHQNGKSIVMATHDYALILKYPHKTLKCEGNQVFEVVQKTL
ncbi:MAG: ATP-binding cassette domain-containing protein [Flavobacteriaceae bacterium]